MGSRVRKRHETRQKLEVNWINAFNYTFFLAKCTFGRSQHTGFPWKVALDRRPTLTKERVTDWVRQKFSMAGAVILGRGLVSDFINRYPAIVLVSPIFCSFFWSLLRIIFILFSRTACVRPIQKWSKMRPCFRKQNHYLKFPSAFSFHKPFLNEQRVFCGWLFPSRTPERFQAGLSRPVVWNIAQMMPVSIVYFTLVIPFYYVRG